MDYLPFIAALLALLVLSVPASAARHEPQAPGALPAEEDIARAEEVIASAQRAAAATDTWLPARAAASG